MTKITITPKTLQGTIAVPPSKSLAHRAIICAALAPGMSRISGIDYSEDIEATIEGMKALGAIIKQEGDTLIIDGSITLGLGRVEIDAHESGSTLRFLMPLSLVNFSRVHLKENLDKDHLMYTMISLINKRLPILEKTQNV